jgi:DNA polymerase theta
LLRAAGVVVATIERANMLVTRLMEADPSLPQLGLVVVDELHLLGADNRGCALELLLNKLRCIGGSCTEFATN